MRTMVVAGGAGRSSESAAAGPGCDGAAAGSSWLPAGSCRDVRGVRLACAHVGGARLVRCVRVAGAGRGEVLPLAVWRPGRRWAGSRRAVGITQPGLHDRAGGTAALALPV